MKRRSKPLAGILDDFRARFDTAVGEYREAVAGLNRAEAALYEVANQAAKNPQDLEAWHDEMNRIIAMQTTMETVESSVQAIGDFFASASDFLGLSGFRSKNLGLIFPAVPWATLALITGGAAAIWIVIDGVIAFVNVMRRKAIDEANIARADTGTAPLPYPPDLLPGAGGGLTGGLQSTADILKWFVIGGVLLLVAPGIVGKKR